MVSPGPYGDFFTLAFQRNSRRSGFLNHVPFIFISTYEQFQAVHFTPLSWWIVVSHLGDQPPVLVFFTACMIFVRSAKKVNEHESIDFNFQQQKSS